MISHILAVATPLTLNVSTLTSDVNATTANYNYIYSGVTPDGFGNGSTSGGIIGTTLGNNGSYNVSMEYTSPVFPSYIRTTSMVSQR